MVYTPAFGGSVPIKIDGTAATVAGGVITDVRAVAAGETVAIPANGYVMVFGNDFTSTSWYREPAVGTLMFLFGGCTTAWVIGAKLYKQCHDLPVRAVTDQPLFYLSLLAVVLGVQLFLAGFLGELIDRNAADRNKYLIEKTLDNQ